MHEILIPQSVIDRVIDHRGAVHIYQDFDPTRTALLVVDMQNAFMMPGVAHVLCKTALEIVPNINQIAAAMRTAGGTVVWVVTTFGEKSLTDWPVLHEMAGPVRTARRITALAEDNIGHKLWDQLDVKPEDLTITKAKYSAFSQGSEPLADTLRKRGIDTVIVSGTVTGVCCESTARDAMMLNFKTIMVSDANAAMTDEDHNASLIAFYLAFGDILSTEMILSHLAHPAKAVCIPAAPSAA